MRTIYPLLSVATALFIFSCNELRRGGNSNLNETENEAAAEANADKFEGNKKQDAKFVYDAIATHYGEIKLAELANQKSRTPGVKEIAQKMQTDHTATLNKLKTLAQAKAISVPVEEPEAAKRKLEDLAGESAEDFDEEWCSEMMDQHDDSIDEFEKRLEVTEDAELKEFINETLPVLKRHHESLRAYDEREKDKDS